MRERKTRSRRIAVETIAELQVRGGDGLGQGGVGYKWTHLGASLHLRSHEAQC